MKFMRYNKDRPHQETCGFITWDNELGRMRHCGSIAVGQRGVNKTPSMTPLCEEHFDTARINAGVSKWDVVMEPPLKKGRR